MDIEKADIERQHLVDDLTRQIQALELEEKQLEDKLKSIRAHKLKLLDQLKENTDEKIQADRLTALYEQRKNK